MIYLYGVKILRNIYFLNLVVSFEIYFFLHSENNIKLEVPGGIFDPSFKVMGNKIL